MNYFSQGYVTSIESNSGDLFFCFEGDTQYRFSDKKDLYVYNVIFNRNIKTPSFKGILEGESIILPKSKSTLLSLLQMAYEEKATFEFQKRGSRWSLVSIIVGRKND